MVHYSSGVSGNKCRLTERRTWCFYPECFSEITTKASQCVKPREKDLRSRCELSNLSRSMMSHTVTFSRDLLWRARLFSPFLDQPNVGTRFAELTVESQLSLQKVAVTVSPVSSVCLKSALCLCCTFSVFGGSSCPVSGKAHIGYKAVSHHVSVWSLIP